MSENQLKCIVFCAFGFLGANIFIWLTYLFIYFLVNGHI